MGLLVIASNYLVQFRVSYYGLEEDAPFNEFTQYIVRKPYAWLVERVPNINNFLN